jgi:glycolate dehydrogenase FAD-linked subunit
VSAKRATALGRETVETTRRALVAILGDDAVLAGDSAAYLGDETEGRGLRGHADAVALPATTLQVAELVAWCYEHGVAIVPRGGGTGFAGGAVPVEGGVVVSLERMDRVLDFDPGLWRMRVEAGVRTATVRRLARENGLLFPPDPGAAEQSHIGGNIATNAGGPHAFKYGVTGAWVTGLEAVVPPGDVVRVGGPIRKDVAGYDLRSLLIGSEGTLGIITDAWLRLLPAPEASLPVVAFLPDIARGTDAVAGVLESGSVPAALEFADARTLLAAGPSFPSPLPDGAEFMVLAEADGSVEEATRLRAELIEAIGDAAVAVVAPTERAEVEALWRWRDGVSLAVTALRGGKASEDIVVPVDRLGEAIEEVLVIGRAHGLEACSWGHAGDGNLHATFMLEPDDPDAQREAGLAAEELFELAVRLGGSISGEHGVGWVKRGELARQWPPPALRLHEEIKRSFDPKGLLNPGKKLARL